MCLILTRIENIKKIEGFCLRNSSCMYECSVGVSVKMYKETESRDVTSNCNAHPWLDFV